VHLLLACLGAEVDNPLEGLGEFPGIVSSMPPAEEHRLLAAPELGLPPVEDLLRLPEASTSASVVAAVLDGPAAARSLERWIRPGSLPGSGLQPSSPLLLVLVVPDSGQGALSERGEEVEPPRHIWQVSPDGFERLVAGHREEVVELAGIPGLRGRLYCLAFRLSLPVITGRVYQKFYTQFVHARCTVCGVAPNIPTLCLLCGTFLCCNSECCRKRDEGGQPVGEVTQHAQTCGFGTCIFLQLSNSLVHIVADGFIACWGSLYLDGHGEEEYNLSRPLHISEARLQQLTQSVREVAFDFESRLKWKKVIFV